MLYVALMKIRDGKIKEAIAKRLQWQIPEGMNVVAEYWLQTPDPNVVVAFETDSIALMLQLEAEWDEYFAMTIVPAISAEEGLELGKKMMGQTGYFARPKRVHYLQAQQSRTAARLEKHQHQYSQSHEPKQRECRGTAGCVIISSKKSDTTSHLPSLDYSLVDGAHGLVTLPDTADQAPGGTEILGYLQAVDINTT